MKASPLPPPTLSPRRLQRPRPASPLSRSQTVGRGSFDEDGTTRPDDDDDDDYRNDNAQCLYQISLTDEPAVKNRDTPPLPPKHTTGTTTATASSSSPFSSSTYYGSAAAAAKTPTASPNAAAVPYSHPFRDDMANSLRPVQEYHNGYANDLGVSGSGSGPGSLSGSPSASVSAVTPASAFSSFSSASRTFMAHRRQQSIPNLLPSIATSLGRNISRAMSPDRSRPARPPLPDFQRPSTPGQSTRDWSSSSPLRRPASLAGSRYRDDDKNHDNDGGASDSDSDSRRGSDSDNGYDSDHMAPLSGQALARRGNIYTTSNKTRGGGPNDRAGNINSPGVAGTFSNWLSGNNGTGRASRASSPSAVAVLAAGARRAATPDRPPPLSLTTRPSSRHSRSISFASDVSASSARRGSGAPSPVPSVAPSVTSTSRFSLLASSMTATLSRLTTQSASTANARGAKPSPRGSSSSQAALEADELYHLDIGRALFPGGHPSERDAFSPAAFKNLEVNAVGTLTRLHEAYCQRTVAVRELESEMDACDEELEEAETRAEHLKRQLEGMARKVDEQDREMKALRAELAAERSRQHRGAATAAAAHSATSEDLGVEEAQRLQRQRQRQRRRKSLKSEGSYTDEAYEDEGSESGTEEEEEDEDEEDEEDGDRSSLYSRSQSPTVGGGVSNNGSSVSHPRVAALANKGPSASAAPPLNAFQKLVKNMTAAIKDEMPEADTVSNCRNCEGRDASFAWNTVSILRDENKHLKQRVSLLEVAVDGALDAAQGVGF